MIGSGQWLLDATTENRICNWLAKCERKYGWDDVHSQWEPKTTPHRDRSNRGERLTCYFSGNHFTVTAWGGMINSVDEKHMGTFPIGLHIIGTLPAEIMIELAYSLMVDSGLPVNLVQKASDEERPAIARYIAEQQYDCRYFCNWNSHLFFTSEHKFK